MKIIDNINSLWGDDLKASLGPSSKLKIAASTFSIYAFETLKKELQSIESLEFIFTSPTFVPEEVTDKIKKEQKKFYIPQEINEKNLYGTEYEIALKNQMNQRAIARECAEWIRKKASFRSNSTKSGMQQIAIIKDSPIVGELAVQNIAYSGFSGFSAVDLGYQNGDQVSNIINKMDEAPITKTYLDLFENIWRDKVKLSDVTETLCDYISNVYQENSPEATYFYILYNIFNEFLEDLNEDVLPNDLTGYKNSKIWNTLFNFQQDAATGIINKLESFNGCILADSVGLGKTFSALAVVKYYELRNKSVLVLCPKKLSDNWLTYIGNKKTNLLIEDRLNYDVLCHTDLLRTTGSSNGMKLNEVWWENYDLIVIDESHNFRNNNPRKDYVNRYQKLMNDVLKKGVKTKVLMLSATPVNNRFNDLKNQLALAYEGVSENLSKKLNVSSTIEDIFRNAQRVFNLWSKLPAEERTAQRILSLLDLDFMKILDSVTIARSRKHIETFYDTSDIGKFPTRLPPISNRCPLTEKSGVMSFSEIYETLLEVTMSVYSPLSYVQPSKIRKYEEIYDTSVMGGRGNLRQKDRENSLRKLMAISLLKRIESSVDSFRITLERVIFKYQRTIDNIALFQQTKSSFSQEDYRYSDVDEMDNNEDIAFDEYDERNTQGEGFAEGKVKVDFNDMDTVSWKRDLSADISLLKEILTEMKKVGIEDDAKLNHLANTISIKINKPINERNHKVLVFTAYADTARYLYDNLYKLKGDLKRHNIALVTGSGTIKTNLNRTFDFQSVLTLFSPISKKKDKIMPEIKEEIDILIATDCISEGQNLQDCDYLINYDIHWNPVRVIQRFGRIDRIGSPNNKIQLVNYWPDIELDDYIDLKERVENKMVVVDATAAGQDNILKDNQEDIAYRKEQLKKLQDEVIEMEDLKTGVNITDLGLNDFRMDLLSYIKDHENIVRMPSGLHCLVPPVVSSQLDNRYSSALNVKEGVIFILRSLNDTAELKKHNQLHPFYLVYISDQGEVLLDYTKIKNILDITRNLCKGKSEPNMELCNAFNKETKDGRNMKKYSGLLDKAISSIREKKDEKDVDSLFSDGGTTVGMKGIEGLNDFELISFIVVRQ